MANTTAHRSQPASFGSGGGAPNGLRWISARVVRGCPGVGLPSIGTLIVGSVVQSERSTVRAPRPALPRTVRVPRPAGRATSSRRGTRAVRRWPRSPRRARWCGPRRSRRTSRRPPARVVNPTVNSSAPLTCPRSVGPSPGVSTRYANRNTTKVAARTRISVPARHAMLDPSPRPIPPAIPIAAMLAMQPDHDGQSLPDRGEPARDESRSRRAEDLPQCEACSGGEPGRRPRQRDESEQPDARTAVDRGLPGSHRRTGSSPGMALAIWSTTRACASASPASTKPEHGTDDQERGRDRQERPVRQGAGLDAERVRHGLLLEREGGRDDPCAEPWVSLGGRRSPPDQAA